LSFPSETLTGAEQLNANNTQSMTADLGRNDWEELKNHLKQLTHCPVCILSKSQSLVHSLRNCKQLPSNLCYTCMDCRESGKCAIQISRRCRFCFLPATLHNDFKFGQCDRNEVFKTVFYGFFHHRNQLIVDSFDRRFQSLSEFYKFLSNQLHGKGFIQFFMLAYSELACSTPSLNSMPYAASSASKRASSTLMERRGTLIIDPMSHDESDDFYPTMETDNQLNIPHISLYKRNLRNSSYCISNSSLFDVQQRYEIIGP
jgi:hypothetical protein